MKLEDTKIEVAGVFLCCVGSIARELIGIEFELGAKSKCNHCKEPFTLISINGHNIWKPDWQIQQDEQNKKP